MLNTVYLVVSFLVIFKHCLFSVLTLCIGHCLTLLNCFYIFNIVYVNFLTSNYRHLVTCLSYFEYFEIFNILFEKYVEFDVELCLLTCLMFIQVCHFEGCLLIVSLSSFRSIRFFYFSSHRRGLLPLWLYEVIQCNLCRRCLDVSLIIVVVLLFYCCCCCRYCFCCSFVVFVVVVVVVVIVKDVVDDAIETLVVVVTAVYVCSCCQVIQYGSVN